MLRFNFNIDIDSSFVPKIKSNNNLFFRHGSFKWWPKKHWEIQIARWSPETLFSLDIDFRFRGQDHAGPKFRLEILGMMFNIHMYDERHWNYDANRWEMPSDVEGDENDI